jgi:hypothetical protein
VILAASTEVAITTAATVYGQQPQEDRSDNGGLAATLNATNYVKGHTVAVNRINATTNATLHNVALWDCFLTANITIQPGAYQGIICQVFALPTDRVLVTNHGGYATVVNVLIDEPPSSGQIMIWLKNDNPVPIQCGRNYTGISIMVFEGARAVIGRTVIP